MLLLDQNNAIESWLAPDQPDRVVAMSVLEGSAPGRFEGLTNGGILFGPLDYTFVLGLDDADGLAEAESCLWRAGAETLLSPAVCMSLGLFERWQFARKPQIKRRVAMSAALLQEHRLRDLVKGVPVGFAVRRIDQNLFSRFDTRVLLGAAYGSETEAYERTLGYAVIDAAGQLCCETAAVFFGGGEASIGVATSVHARRKGLAAASCAALFLDLSGRGFTPAWSCDEDNTASMRLAGKLGLEPAQTYIAATFGQPP